jgi:hemerythrin
VLTEGNPQSFIKVSPNLADIECMFEWKKEYSVNIASIDAQHQNLFAIAAELHKAMCSGQARPVMGKILDRLVNYTATHFSHEERLMQQHCYPDFAAHKLAHDALKRQVVDFQTEFKSGKVAVSVELMSFLQDWLQKHIQETEKRYSPFLVQRKVA